MGGPGRARPGIGTELARAVLDWARTEGAPTIALWVTDGNDEARRMYERLGFVATGEWAPMPHHPPTGEIRMRAAIACG